MLYLLDSDWVIAHLGGMPEATDLLLRLAPDGLAVSMVTYMEAYQGVLRNPAAREEQEALLNTFMAAVVVLPFSFEVARRCACVREVLRTQKRRVRPRSLDLVIAATALEHDLVLVTRNTDDYADIPGLNLNQPT